MIGPECLRPIPRCRPAIAPDLHASPTPNHQHAQTARLASENRAPVPDGGSKVRPFRHHFGTTNNGTSIGRRHAVSDLRRVELLIALVYGPEPALSRSRSAPASPSGQTTPSTSSHLPPMAQLVEVHVAGPSPRPQTLGQMLQFTGTSTCGVQQKLPNFWLMSHCTVDHVTADSNSPGGGLLLSCANSRLSPDRGTWDSPGSTADHPTYNSASLQQS